jgi:hypothetical protein
MRLALEGEAWPSDWAVPYASLDGWGMLTWFYQPPAESEGLVAGRDYQMSDTPTPSEFAGFLDNLQVLIGQIRPDPEPASSLEIHNVKEF